MPVYLSTFLLHAMHHFGQRPCASRRLVCRDEPELKLHAGPFPTQEHTLHHATLAEAANARPATGRVRVDHI